MMRFSVLISVYHKNTEEEVIDCFSSILEQSCQPDEIILVIDGPVNDSVRKVIDKYSDLLPIQCITQKVNMGLAKSLNIGLKYCSYEYVFRMDIDDICAHNRFRLQIEFLHRNPKVDILGGQILQFMNKGDWKVARKVPKDGQKLKSFFRFRNPVNHPTVAMRKAAIMQLGGYPETRLSQDYLLWIKAYSTGLKIVNMPDILVYMRVDNDLYARRGIKSCHYDLKPYEVMYEIGMTTTLEYIIGKTVRLSYCIYASLKSVLRK